MNWFDGHLDLAYIAQHGRDLTQPADSCAGTLQPATVTFPALAAANVKSAIAVIFVRQRKPGVDGPYCFDNPDQAFTAALTQLNLYRHWETQGHIRLAKTQTANPKTRISKVETQNFLLSTQSAALSTLLALEGAAPIRHLDDADFFADAGVRMISLAWGDGSHWSGGDQTGADLTPDGKALIHRLDELGIVHDVSHLSEPAFWSLLETAQGPIVASHSNCRALLPGAKFPQRHLSDAQIRALANRRSAASRAKDSIIGINLFARFLIPPPELEKRPAKISDVIHHLEHMAQLAGRRDFLALGSDMDSGFGADLLPEDLQGPAHLNRLADALTTAGWPDDQITDFATRWSKIPALTP